MADEISAFRVWAKDTPVEPGLVRLVRFEIAGVKYVDLLVYSLVGGAHVWRAAARLKGSEIDDLVTALAQDVSGAGVLALGQATLDRLRQHLELWLSSAVTDYLEGRFTQGVDLRVPGWRWFRMSFSDRW